MKKIIVMILMLGASLPSLAKEDTEIKLMCTLTDQRDGEVSHIEFGIYEGDTWDKETDACNEKQGKQTPDESCITYESSPVNYTQTFYKGNVEAIKEEVDRVDGRYKLWQRGKLNFTGTCKPFESKF